MFKPGVGAPGGPPSSHPGRIFTFGAHARDLLKPLRVRAGRRALPRGPGGRALGGGRAAAAEAAAAEGGPGWVQLVEKVGFLNEKPQVLGAGQREYWKTPR